LKNNEVIEKTIKGLKLIDIESGKELVPDENDESYHCSMDKSINIYYNEKYIFTLETVPIWKIMQKEEEPNTI